MAESLSLIARLGLDDELSPGLKAAGKATESFGSKLKKGALAGAALQIGMSAVNKALSSLSSHMDAAVSRVDTLNNYPKVMSALGYSAESAEKSINNLSAGIEGLPTSLDEIVNNAQMLTASLGDIDKGTKTATALNDMFLAGGQGAEGASRGLQQYNQMLAKGKVDQQSWNTLVEVASGQMNQLAKSMLGAGADQKDLYEALQSGKISMEEFNDAVIKLDEEGGKGFDSFKTQALAATGGIKTAMTNIGTAVTKGIANCIQAIDDMLSSNGMPKIAEMAGMAKDGVNKAFTAMEDIISSIDIKGVVAAATPYYNAFKTAVGAAGKAIKAIGKFLAEHAGAITSLIGPAAIMLGIWKGYKVISSFAPAIKVMTSAFSGLANGVLTKLAPQLVATGAAETEAGAGAATAAPSMMRMGAAVLMMGAGIGLAAAGLTLLALGAIKLASAGAPAVAILGGLILAMAGLAVGAALLGPALTAGAIGFVAFGAAVLMAGAGMALMALGVATLAGALPAIATYATSAAGGLAILATTIVALGIAALAAAPGLLAVSAGFLAAGAAAIGATAGLSVAAVVMRSLAKSSRTISAGIGTLGGSFKSASAGARSFASSTKSAFSGIESSVNSAANRVSSFASRSRSSFNAFKVAAKSAATGAKAAMSNLSSSMTTTGKHAGQGLANGLRAKYGAVYAAAKYLAKGAEKGATITLKVHSPSRVFSAIGSYVGQGFALGIESEARNVKNATRNMVSIPSAEAPGMGLSLNSSYDYGAGGGVIEVPVNLDGKEVARITAPYSKLQIDKIETRNNRLKGIR